MGIVGKRSQGQVLRSRGIGTIVGTVIGFLWMYYGLNYLPEIIRIPLGIIGIMICFLL